MDKLKKMKKKAVLQKKGEYWCHILVKNWIFDNPFHKKLPVLSILVPVIRSDHKNKAVFWGNWALEAVEASKVAEAAEVNEAAEASEAWNITTEDFRVVQLLEFIDLRTYIALFWCFEKKIFDRIMKTHVEF